MRGTGFNIDPGGLIVTNRHLVEDALNIRVSFPGRGTYSGQEWYLSAVVDLAFIRLQAEDLPTAGFAAEAPRRGDQLLVIGNPLQFARIANRGIFVGYRAVPGRDLPYLVVDALIYPGNSGSPLFNAEGEVVGVIFATLRSDDPAEVRGLAVDAREVLLMMEELQFKP